jgi:hypothetical protein
VNGSRDIGTVVSQRYRIIFRYQFGTARFEETYNEIVIERFRNRPLTTDRNIISHD